MNLKTPKAEDAATLSVVEGTVPFSHHTLPKKCSTWYKVVGDLTASATICPLVVLHGGPGMAHNYMLPLTDLYQNYGIPVIFYDQIGCGKSTHLREKRLDESFWTIELFIAELENLLLALGVDGDYDVLGQSWGGVLATCFAIKQPPRLRRLILSNAPASLDLWMAGCDRARAQLPRDVDATLTRCEAAKDYDNPAYKDACMTWYKSFTCRTDPWPDHVLQTFEQLEEDDTVYFTMNGPSEFTVVGSLRGFTLEGQISKVKAPTLLIHGEYDTADEAGIAPFLRDIKDAKAHRFVGCSHFCHVEDPEAYMRVVAGFLR